MHCVLLCLILSTCDFVWLKVTRCDVSCNASKGLKVSFAFQIMTETFATRLMLCNVTYVIEKHL